VTSMTSTFREFLRRIGMLLHRERFAKELEDEMQLHLELRRQQQEESGVAPKDARAAAYRRFGNPTLVRERSYKSWGWSWLEGLLQDMLYGLRAMLRSPGVTIVALLSLALGIGANTAIFSLMDAVMLRSLPVKNPQQLVLLGTANDRGFENGFDVTDLFSYPVYRQLQQRNRVFSDFAAVLSTDRTIHGFIGGPGAAEPMTVQLVSGTYFSTLGVTAMMGRTIGETDDRSEGARPIAVISNSWWRRKLGGDPTALGRTIRLNQTTFTIVGIAPPEFFGTEVGESTDIWVPVSMVGQITSHSTSYTDDLDQCLFVFGRLRPGVTLTQAETEVNLLRQQILPHLPDAQMGPSQWRDLKSTHIPITPMARGLSGLRRQFSEPLKVLMGIVGLVLLIACANIANLLLARSTTRARKLCRAAGARRKPRSPRAPAFY
jgi:predicted permease